MEHLLNHLIQRHLVPVLLLPVVCSGLFCFAIFGLPEAFRSSSRAEEIILVVITILGILGTLGTSICLRVVRRQPPTWRVFELGRTAWSVLIIAAWLAGVGCGFLMLYETSR